MAAPISALPIVTFDVDQNFFVESLGGPWNTLNYLNRFPDAVYNKSIDSHLMSFMYALLGPTGTGFLRQQYMEARLQIEESQINGADLDSLYSSPFQFARLAEETYTIDADSSILPADQRAEILAADSSFRNRAVEWLRAIRAGGTVDGLRLAASSGLGQPVDVIENYKALYDQFCDLPLGIPYHGSTTSLNEIILIPRNDVGRNSLQSFSFTGEPTSGFFTLTVPVGPQYIPMAALGGEIVEEVPSVYQQAILDDGPTAYWPLDEVSGDVAFDASGNGHHGLYVDAILNQQGPSIEFPSILSNIDEGVTIPFNSAFSASDFTMEVWVNNQGPTVHNSIFQNGFSTGAGIASQGITSGQQVFLVELNSTFESPITAGPAGWYHVVLTATGSSWELFINGVSVQTGTNTITPNSGDEITIGGAHSGPFFGNTAQVAFYDSVLTGAQIRNHFTLGLGIVQPSGSPFSTGSSSGPRSLDFSPNGSLLTVTDSTSNHVSVFSVASDGTLTNVSGSPFSLTTPLDVKFSPSGSYFVVSDATNHVTIYKVSGTTVTVGSSYATGNNPTSIDFTSDGEFLAVANFNDNTITVFAASSGPTLTEVVGSPFPTGNINTPDYQALILSEGPNAYWPLNETSGTTAHDVSGNGFNGTYHASPTLNQPGSRIGLPSVLFDGGTQYESSPWNASFNGSTFTMEAWCKIVDEGTVFSNVPSEADSGFQIVAENTISLGIVTLSSTGSFSHFATVSPGEWHHVVITGTGSSTTTWILYVDGVQIATGTYFVSGGGSSNTWNSDGTPTIGVSLSAGGGGQADFFEGNIANVAFYDSVLTHSQIAAHYAAGLAHGMSIAFSSDGLLAVTNSLPDTVSIFSIDHQGALTQVPESPFDVGTNPEAIGFNPSGNLLAVANSSDNTVSVFAVDPSGSLTPVLGSPSATGKQPVSVEFSTDGKLLGTVNSQDNTMSIFRVNGNGSLSILVGHPFAAFVTGNDPLNIAFGSTGWIANTNNGDNTVSILKLNVVLPQLVLQTQISNTSQIGIGTYITLAPTPFTPPLTSSTGITYGIVTDIQDDLVSFDLIDGPQLIQGQEYVAFCAQAQTTPLPYDATYTQVQAAIQVLPICDNGANVMVTGGPLPDHPISIAFTGELANVPILPIQVNIEPDLLTSIGFITDFPVMADAAGNKDIGFVLDDSIVNATADGEIIQFAPGDVQTMVYAVDVLKPATSFITTTLGQSVTLRQPANTTFSSTTYTEVLRYVTGEVNVPWPSVDGQTNWIEAGVEHEAPAASTSLSSQYANFHNINAIIAYTGDALEDGHYVDPSGSVFNPWYLPYYDVHTGSFNPAQVALMPFLEAYQGTDYQFLPSYALNTQPDRPVVTTSINDVALINDSYPVTYLGLPGVQQQALSAGHFWASNEVGQGSDYLEIDLGQPQAVNYIYFEATNKPFLIDVAYDLLDESPQRRFIPATIAAGSVTSLSFLAGGVSPWTPCAINVTNSLGQILYTRFIRIGFTRNPSGPPYELPGIPTNLIPYSVEVRNLRIGRNVNNTGSNR